MDRRIHGLRLVALLAGAFLILGAAITMGAVAVYKNELSSRSKVHKLNHTRGRDCHRDFLKGIRAMGVVVTHAPEACGYSPPVAGDAPRPDHRLEAVGKISKETPGPIRDRAYLMLAVRVGGDGRYELRVYPRVRDFELVRRPTGGPFPVTGHKQAINGIGERNRLMLQAFGDHVIAKVNGKRLASVTDPSPGDLNGTRVEIGAGSKAHSSKNTSASLKDLTLSVPNP